MLAIIYYIHIIDGISNLIVFNQMLSVSGECSVTGVTTTVVCTVIAANRK